MLNLRLNNSIPCQLNFLSHFLLRIDLISKLWYALFYYTSKILNWIQIGWLSRSIHSCYIKFFHSINDDFRSMISSSILLSKTYITMMNNSFVMRSTVGIHKLYIAITIHSFILIQEMKLRFEIPEYSILYFHCWSFKFECRL